MAAELKEIRNQSRDSVGNSLRKENLKRPQHFIRTGESKTLASEVSQRRVFECRQSLSLDLSVVNYTSNKKTKDSFEREAAKLSLGQRASGTRYCESLARGAARQRQAAHLSGSGRASHRTQQDRHGPLRIEHARLHQFHSDFMAADKKAAREEAVKAWKELKAMDAPKTYESWTRAQKLKTQRVVSVPQFLR